MYFSMVSSGSGLPALAQSDQAGVGMHHVDGPLPGAVEVVELIGDPVPRTLR